MRHRWTDDQMLQTLDIVSRYARGPLRDAAGQALVAQINTDPNNPIAPSAIGKALQAAENALKGDSALTSKRLRELAARRKA